MSNIFKKNLSWVIFLGLLLASLPLHAGPAAGDQGFIKKPKTEEDFLANLNPAYPEKVIMSAAGKLEDMYRKDMTKTSSIPLLKKLLSDSRPPVRMKVARILGNMHAPMSDDDMKLVFQMLKSSDWKEVIDALKALRGLPSRNAVPEILPLLNNPQPNVVRDACRTLAEIGGKDCIPKIEPLLQSPDQAIRKDALDAVTVLKARP